MQLDRLRRGDWGGIVCMAIGLGSLITVLEEGAAQGLVRRPDRSGYAAILAAIFIPAFIVIELVHREPFINLRLLARRSLGARRCMGFVTGPRRCTAPSISLPVYLAQVQGYNALQIGEVVMWLGLPQLLIFPFVPMVMQRVDRAADGRVRHPAVRRQLLHERVPDP